ncbi:flagellar motor switch phosphatase FliY [Peribacillus kribbensis]|uniref:flagellar motor switch phosphatase FliY n=1 Tax=Peribacillus kribbensis TaxID=356658 RepID=UPI0004289960|nr:flagellar motor switch phosphatase FliY [Peribacillus kribbensis]
MVSGEMLSQDEIDALLRGSSESAEEPAIEGAEDYFTSMERDALGEIGNISFGSSATALSTLLNQKVDITTPSVDVVPIAQLEKEFPTPYVAIQVHYTIGFTGLNLLVIKQSDAAIIADLMLGGDGTKPSEELNEIHLSAVQEAMNQMMGSAATSMSTIFNKKVDISPPSIDLMNLKEGSGENVLPKEDMLARISFRLKVGSLIDSNIMQLLPLTFAKSLVNDLLNPEDTSVDSTSGTVEEIVPDIKDPAREEEPVYTQSSRSTQEEQAVPVRPAHAAQHMGQSSGPSAAQVNVQPASFAAFTSHQGQEKESGNLDILLDIPLQVTVELGRTKRSVKELLEISSGSIIELDKLAGEPVDVLVNSRLIAKGEVVVIDENFGVRITDIISQTDRIKKLR